MEFQRDITIRKINEWLSRLQNFVTLNGVAGKSDFSGSAEDFFCDVINKIYNLELINLNLEEFNFPAIDLGDKAAKICYQVTAVGSSAKLKHTIEKFKKYQLGKDYNHLVMLIISGAQKPRAVLISDVKVEVKNLADLMRDIYGFDQNKLSGIEEIFSSGIVSSLPSQTSILDVLSSGRREVGDCDAFIESTGYKYDLEELAAIRGDIQILSDKIARLARNERHFLFLMLALGFQPLNYAGYPAENHFYTPLAVLENRFPDSLGNMHKLIQSVDYHGLIYFEEDYSPRGATLPMEVLGVKFYGKSDWNIFVPMMSFLRSKPNQVCEALLQQIIFYNDFSCFN